MWWLSTVNLCFFLAAMCASILYAHGLDHLKAHLLFGAAITTIITLLEFGIAKSFNFIGL